MRDFIDIIGIGAVVFLAVAALALVAVALGGIFGYAVVTFYNGVFGMSVDPMLGALIGSIVSGAGVQLGDE
ncbi:hypothetical protein ACFQDG_01240 [Natronoarchaeum mannanilyticum]|uniref:Uncharacterized protein n=1 Tax=Natronoarchaeum mannanilyticum TaxID=926360 RepID=A0AAV3TD49_9EURY